MPRARGAARGRAAAPATPPPEGTIAISGPNQMVLAKEKKPATLELRLPAARDPKTSVRVYASTGTLSDLSDSGATQVGTFTAPDAFFPHLAIVGAVAKVGGKAAVGYKTILLLGVGNLTVKAKPKEAVTVTIGPDSFGPVQADKTGNASVPVTVAPGYAEAIVVGTDRTLPLPSAPFKRILALALEDTLPADGATATELQAMVVDRTGKPDPKAMVAFKAARGSTGTVTSPRPGLYAVKYTPPASPGPGNDTVTYSVVDDPNSKETLSIRLTVGTSVKVRLDPPAWLPSTKLPMVFVSIDGSDGKPMDAVVELTASEGKLGATKALSPGRYSAQLSPPDNFGGKHELKVNATIVAQGGARSRAEAALELKPGDPNRLEVVAQELSLKSDGATSVPITVRALDQSGNVVPGVALTAKAAEGTVAPPEANEDGSYVFRFAPPIAFSDHNVTVGIEGGGLQAEVPVKLLSSETRFALAIKAGASSNFVAMTAPSFALELDVRLVSILFLGLEAGGTIWSRGQAVKSSVYAFPVSLLLRLEGSFENGLLLYLAAGPTADFVSASTSSAGQSLSESLLVWGAQAQAGIGYRFGRSSLALELKELFANARGKVVTGQIGGFGAGLRFSVAL